MRPRAGQAGDIGPRRQALCGMCDQEIEIRVSVRRGQQGNVDPRGPLSQTRCWLWQPVTCKHPQLVSA